MRSLPSIVYSIFEMSSAVQKLFFKNFIFRNQVQYVQVFDTSGNYSMYSNNRDVKFLIKVNILHEHLYSLTQPELVGKLSSSFSMEVLEIVFQASSRIFQNSFFFWISAAFCSVLLRRFHTSSVMLRSGLWRPIHDR